MGRLALLLFDLQGVFLYLCSREVPLDLKNEKYVVFIFYLSRVHSLVLNSYIVFILEHPSTGDNFQMLSLGPFYFLQHTEGLLCAWRISAARTWEEGRRETSWCEPLRRACLGFPLAHTAGFLGPGTHGVSSHHVATSRMDLW